MSASLGAERPSALLADRPPDAERRRADSLQALLAAIVASSSDASVSSTPNGVVTTWNEGAQKMFGYSANEAVGRHVREVIRPGPERWPRIPSTVSATRSS